MRTKADEVMRELIELRQDPEFDDIKPTIRKAIAIIEMYRNRVSDVQALLRSVDNVLKE